jgi:hypothetical protein
VDPVGPSIPSRFTLYTDDPKVPKILAIELTTRDPAE